MENCSIGLIAGAATGPSPRPPHPPRRRFCSTSGGAACPDWAGSLRDKGDVTRITFQMPGDHAEQEKNDQKAGFVPTIHPIASRSGRQPQSPPQTHSRRAAQAPWRSQTCRRNRPTINAGPRRRLLAMLCPARLRASPAAPAKAGPPPRPRPLRIGPFPLSRGCADRSTRREPCRSERQATGLFGKSV